MWQSHSLNIFTKTWDIISYNCGKLHLKIQLGHCFYSESVVSHWQHSAITGLPYWMDSFQLLDSCWLPLYLIVSEHLCFIWFDMTKQSKGQWIHYKLTWWQPCRTGGDKAAIFLHSVWMFIYLCSNQTLRNEGVNMTKCPLFSGKNYNLDCRLTNWMWISHSLLHYDHSHSINYVYLRSLIWFYSFHLIILHYQINVQ